MKIKKLLAFGLAAAMAVGMSACSDDAADPAASTTGTTTGGAKPIIAVSLPWLGTQNWAEANDQFKTAIETAGYEAMVLHADNKVEVQQQQIDSMITAGAEIIIIGPVDGTALAAQADNAAAQGIKIFGYDRLIENTVNVDAVVQFGSLQTGREQGQALLDGLAAKAGDAPWNIELFAGGPTDPNAPNFFKGAMEILQPKIDDGTLVVVSGQTTFEQVATKDWENSVAQTRMEQLLAGFYADTTVDGVLSPNDGIARAILTATDNAGQGFPPVSGLDAEEESVKWIGEGKQWSTVAKPTDQLVAKTMELVKIVVDGGTLPAGNETASNGARTDVQVFALPPTVVTKDNCKTFFTSVADPTRAALCGE
ncbi:MAG: sugar-binding protein [Propionibacteriaceae bacterium]|jgi:putative multiple sugar transport system substrate-binding protein|nr:sugar-binding protein [Propionibacteriaceae bacterium]